MTIPCHHEKRSHGSHNTGQGGISFFREVLLDGPRDKGGFLSLSSFPFSFVVGVYRGSNGTGLGTTNMHAFCTTGGLLN